VSAHPRPARLPQAWHPGRKSHVQQSEDDLGVPELITRALALHHAGAFAEAERVYRRVLAQGEDTRTLTLLGTLHAQTGRFDSAIELLTRSLARQERQPFALNSLANALMAVGRCAEAVARFDISVSLKPDDAVTWTNRGKALGSLALYDEALASFERALALRPDYAEAHAGRAEALGVLGEAEAAAAAYEKAIALKPDSADYHAAYGNALFESGSYAQASERYARALALRPGDASLYYNHGNALRAQGRFADAVGSYDQALGLRGDFFEACFNKALALQQMGIPAEAEKAYGEANRLNPRSAECHNNRGNALAELQRHLEALEEYETATALKAHYAAAWNNKGNALRALRRHDDALIAYQQATNIDPAYVDAHRNHGLALLDLHRNDEALVCFERALTYDFSSADAHSFRGMALYALGRHAEALESLDRALRLQADRAEVHNARGLAQHALNQKSAALASFEEALRLRPEYASAYNNRGLSLHALGCKREALASYDKAIALEPDYAAAYYNRAITLRETMRLQEALSSVETAIEFNPEQPYALGELLFLKTNLCHWDKLRDYSSQLTELIGREVPAAVPFPLLSLWCAPEIQRRCAETYVAHSHPLRPMAPREKASTTRSGRIRLAYVSANFNPHPVSQLLAGVIECSDPAQFDTLGVSLTENDGSAIHERLAKAFGDFACVANYSDERAAELLRDWGADIVVDLMGFTKGARSGILARRPAPLQVNYLGYAGTMGAPYIDYIIADATIIPPGYERYYTEKVVRMPHTFLPTDGSMPRPEKFPSRAEAGLPETGFVFCSFNNSYKISPEIFAVWMRLLHAVEGSVLWLTARGSAAIESNLLDAAEANGVDKRRLIFAPRTPRWADHIARLSRADLFLDTLPYNAHTTAVDALWAGVPVLTCTGETFAGRVATSLAHAIGMPELVTSSLSEYEARALSLARDKAALSALRAKLDARRSTTPLFNTVLYARNLEAAFAAIVERYRSGAEPAPLTIST
jgi:protein O-GlcNAc transferase